MDRGMAARRGTAPLAEEKAVIHGADHDGSTGAGYLGVATQTEIGVALDEQLVVHRTVSLMASGAALAQGFVFEDELARLFPVAFGAGFVQPGKRQSAGRLADIVPVRVVALNTIHVPLDHGMMIGQSKLGVHCKMALEARLRFLAGVYDHAVECSSPAGFHVPTACPVTGFAARVDAVRPRRGMDPRVDAARKFLCDRLVTGRARIRAHKTGSFYSRRGI